MGGGGGGEWWWGVRGRMKKVVVGFQGADEESGGGASGEGGRVSMGVVGGKTENQEGGRKVAYENLCLVPPSGLQPSS